MRNKKPFLDELSGKATSDSSSNTKQERNTYFVPHCCPVCVYISLFDNINLLTSHTANLSSGSKEEVPFFRVSQRDGAKLQKTDNKNKKM